MPMSVTKLAVLIVFLLSLVANLAHSQEKLIPGNEEILIPAKVVTGFNQYLGQPFLDFGPPLNRLSFAALARYGTGSTTPLTPATPGSALLATTLDPIYLQLVGLNPLLVDPSLLNVRLRDVATNIFADGSLRLPLPGSDEVIFADAAQHGSATPIDLEVWKRARGLLSIQCDDDGTSALILRARNLIPHRLYSVWGNYYRPDFPAGLVPLQTHTTGGLPNAIISDLEGGVTFERTLTGCPLAPDEFGRELLSIDLIFHSDHQLNGTVQATPLIGSTVGKGGLGVGTVSHPHLAFNIAGTQLLTPEGWGNSGSCQPSSTVHCFQDGRFKVEIDWTDFANESGSAQTEACGSDDAGSFYFFSRENSEALVKVLDGCSFNDHFWVFASMATSVEYTLTVTDTQTNQTKTYSNPLGQASEAITDTSAFATCP